MAERLPKKQLRMLEELRRNASLENASFGFPAEIVETRGGPSQPQGPQNLDAFIKERTRLHRESWILPLIDDLIKWGKGEPG